MLFNYNLFFSDFSETHIAQHAIFSLLKIVILCTPIKKLLAETEECQLYINYYPMKINRRLFKSYLTLESNHVKNTRKWWYKLIFTNKK